MIEGNSSSRHEALIPRDFTFRNVCAPIQALAQLAPRLILFEGAERAGERLSKNVTDRAININRIGGIFDKLSYDHIKPHK